MSSDNWYGALRVPNQHAHYSWLIELTQSIDRIVNFGCWSGCEPFALLWILGAKDITVVEKEEKNIAEFFEQKSIVTNLYPKSLQGRSINTLVQDMSLHTPELPDQYFDLAYCEDVLYSLDIDGGTTAVDNGIEQMIRVVKPKGLIIAVESKFRAKFKTRTSKLFDIPITIPVRESEPESMDGFFVSKGLLKIEITGQPPFSYCYCRK